MFYADLRHNTKDKIYTTANGKDKKAPTSRNGFFYITRTGHFANKDSSEEVEFVKSGNMPDYAKNDPKKFWVNADKYEQLKGRTSSVLTIALPNNISKQQRIELVQKFIDEFANKHGFAFTCAIHNHKGSIEGKDQPHLHFMYSERPTLGNADMHPKQFFARYNSKHPERGGVRKLSADVLGYGKNHVDYIRKTTETLINEYLEEHAPTKKINLRGIEIEVPSLVSCLSNREYNKLHGTKLKDVEQLPHWKVQDPKYKDEIAKKIEAIRSVREYNRFELYREYYAAAINEIHAAQVKQSEPQKPQISAAESYASSVRWGAVADVERLEKAVSFDEKLLRVMQSVRDFADYDSTKNIKAQDVRYGYSQNADNKVFVFNVADVSETRLNERFKHNYTDYCSRVLNALETHYDAKLRAFEESFSLSISDFDLKSVIAYHEQHEKILAQIVEPIKSFSMQTKNEVFLSHLDSLKNKESLINSVLEQAQQYKSSNRKEAVQTPQNTPKLGNQNRLEF